MTLTTITGLLLVILVFPAHAFAEDARGLLYAQEAFDILQSDYERLKQSESLSASSVKRLQQQLHEAELTLLKLKGDDAGVTELLEAEVARQATNFERRRVLVERGLVTADDFSKSELPVLIAKSALARHKGDEAANDVLIRRAIEIEERQLKSLERLVSRRFANSSSIARQKLRIAKLIATRTITLPTGS